MNAAKHEAATAKHQRPKQNPQENATKGRQKNNDQSGERLTSGKQQQRNRKQEQTRYTPKRTGQTTQPTATVYHKEE
jgi:hypothetical protein